MVQQRFSEVLQSHYMRPSGELQAGLPCGEKGKEASVFVSLNRSEFLTGQLWRW